MADHPEEIARLLLKIREAPVRLAGQLERAIRRYTESMELEAALLECSERLREELARAEQLFSEAASRKRLH